ncbi:extracellular solute-binding protein [Limibacillus halophilus]|uniref:Putative spermidine/putrescine transport system substrate-binding protein n=1 Tax=Limibacillus halophilus TaxID=1579333 RepID=A0A839SQV9_9PROT|nr:extracellular solute-binding protein [Limibacillus halophilus]MBB3064339.1 putative spermidine/putrescine transport system substrate-binding protein [Limibacillus halophilus]
MKSMKKELSIGAATSAIALAAFTMQAQAAESLTVAFYGGSWGEAIQSCMVDPFVASTGIQVTPEPGVSSVTLAKLKQQKGDPVIDVAWLDGGVSELAAADDLVAALDPAKVPGVSGVIDEGVYRTADGQVYALSTGYYSLGLVYNTDDVKNPPESWWDLWGPDYAGLVTLPSPANAMGVPLFVLINQLAGGTMDNFDPGVAKMNELEVSSYFDASGNATNSFQSGEVIAGAHYANAAWAMADKGLPLRYAVPKEGAPSGDIRVHIVKGTKSMEAAEKFVDFVVAKEQATCMTNRLYVGPATAGITPTPEAQERLPWGADGSVKNLALFDWDEINANRDRITEIFNQKVAGK